MKSRIKNTARLKHFSLVLIAVLLICVPIAGVRATEYTSASYIMSDSFFLVGPVMNSASFSLTGTLSRMLFSMFSSSLIPLVPGTVVSCGKINTPGTYVLGQDIPNITGTCFTVATSSVVIDGGNHTVTAASGNTSYAVMATSTAAGGSAYNNITIRNISFVGFGGGVNANGNQGASNGGNGGSVSVATSSMGVVSANGGSSASTGGNGGSVSLSGTNMDIARYTPTASGGTGGTPGQTGSITVNGSILVTTGEMWSQSDTSWLGARTWLFNSTAYNTGTTTGTTTFSGSAYNAGTVVGDEVLLAYTADSSNKVFVTGNSSFRGTGSISGGLAYDLQGKVISSWDLSSGSVLIGKITGNAIFHDTSYNAGIVSLTSTFNDLAYNAGTTTNATFTAATFDSVAGIPNGDPSGLSNGHAVTSRVTFSTTSAIVFNVGTGAVWSSDTSAWTFGTSSVRWNFSFASSTGTLSGDAIFTNSVNSGVAYGTSTFQTNSHNAGTAINASFYDNTYNSGNVGFASFYNTSSNSHGFSVGTVTNRCDFYDLSSPGIGHCPVGATSYHIPYYYTSSVSNNWDDLGNWWFDTGHTEHVTSLPKTGDTVYLGARMDTGPSAPVTLGSINVAAPATGGGSFSVNFTNASGPANFYASSTNTGVVNGLFSIYGSRAFSQANSGTYSGDVALHEGALNDSTLAHNVTFYETSSNASNGTVMGNAEFASVNNNAGTVVGTASVDTGATLSGTGSVSGNVSNSGTISGGHFVGVVTNNSGSKINGTVTNDTAMQFNGNSYVSNSASLSGDAQFNDTSYNAGTVFGAGTFYGSSSNIGVISTGTFVGELSDNHQSSTYGVVLGSKTRLYTSSAPQFEQLRDFTGTPWTIKADNTLVRLLYGNLIDITNRDPSDTTTLVEQNGGVILRPLATTSAVTSCGVLDSASTTYTLGSDVSNFAYDTCFIVRANGITLDGVGHKVAAQSSLSSMYAISATSTLSVDSVPDAFTNLIVKNITFTNFAHGVLGFGNDVPNGIGGNGASTTILHAVLGDINVNGGDPMEQAGNGGNLYVETSTTTVIMSNGGDSTGCGIGGNGGNIYITTDTYYISYSNIGGQVTGCSNGQSGNNGSSGNTYTTITSNATQAAQQNAAAQNNANNNHVQSTGGAFSPSNFTTISLPFQNIVPLSLQSIPTLGDTNGKGTFTLDQGVFAFISSVLPTSFTNVYPKSLLTLFASSGLSKSQDIISLRNSPLPVKSGDNTPGYFTVKVKDQAIKSYLAYDAKNTITELVNVEANSRISIKLIPVNGNVITASFNGVPVKFIGNTADLVVPAKAGKYVLTSSSTPLTLTLQVSRAQSPASSAVGKVTSFLGKVWSWLKGIF